MPTREELLQLSRELAQVRDRLGAICDRATALQQRLRADASTIVSLDRLAQRRHPPVRKEAGERFEGEEAHFGLDAWEISLINEEG